MKGVGGWGMGDGGWGIGYWAQPPTPNPQSPIPNPHLNDDLLRFNYLYKCFFFM